MQDFQKEWNCADYIVSDSNVAPHKCEQLFSLRGLYCTVWYYT